MKIKFKCKMINMFLKLREDDFWKFCYYLEGIILINNCFDFMDILWLLEYEVRILWDNINFVKEVMGSILRLDFVEDLIKYEVKRNLIFLLDFYVKSNLGLDCDNKLGMNMVVLCLWKIMDSVWESVKIRDICLIVEFSRDLKKVLMVLEEKMDEELLLLWDDFIMFVIFVGEIIIIVFVDEE